MYNEYGEITFDPTDNSLDNQQAFDQMFEKAEKVGCIYDEHPTQKTMRKLG